MANIKLVSLQFITITIVVLLERASHVVVTGQPAVVVVVGNGNGAAESTGSSAPATVFVYLNSAANDPMQQQLQIPPNQLSQSAALSGTSTNPFLQAALQQSQNRPNQGNSGNPFLPTMQQQQSQGATNQGNSGNPFLPTMQQQQQQTQGNPTNPFLPSTSQQQQGQATTNQNQVQQQSIQTTKPPVKQQLSNQGTAISQSGLIYNTVPPRPMTTPTTTQTVPTTTRRTRTTTTPTTTRNTTTTTTHRPPVIRPGAIVYPDSPQYTKPDENEDDYIPIDIRIS